MKNGKCPKCRSTEIYFQKNAFMRGGGMQGNRLVLSFGSTAALDNYVCGQCGYTEKYLSGAADIGKVRAKWKRPKTS